MPQTLLPAVLQIYYFVTNLHTPGAAAELALSQLPLWVKAGQCAQSCASAISSEYSIALGCPQAHAAACLCSLRPVSLFADAADACCRVSCNGAASAYTATDYAGQYGCQYLISSYCEVNGFTTPTGAPNPATLVATSELSQLSTTRPSPSITASSVPCTSALLTALITLSQSSMNPTSSNPTFKSPGNSPPADLSRLAIVLIAIGAGAGLAFAILCIIAIVNPNRLRTRIIKHLKGCLKASLAEHDREDHDREEDEEKTPEPGQNQNKKIGSLRYDSLSISDGTRMPVVPPIRARSLLSESAAASQGLHLPRTVRENYELDIWIQQILMRSKLLDGHVAATAILDTGTVDNWISREKVEEGRFEKYKVGENTKVCRGFSGTDFKPTLRVNISWEGVKARKRRVTPFYVAPEGSGFDVIFGKKFIKKERIVLPNPDPHVFSRRY